MTDPRQKYEDRLIEAALREKLGGRRPPDLSEKVLAASADRPQPARTESRQWLTVRALSLLAVSACLLLAVVGVAWRLQPHEGSRFDGGVALVWSETGSGADPSLPSPAYMDDKVKYFAPSPQNPTPEDMAMSARTHAQERNHLKQAEFVASSELRTEYDGYVQSELPRLANSLDKERAARVSALAALKSKSQAQAAQNGAMMGERLHAERSESLVLGVTPRIILQEEREVMLGTKVTEVGQLVLNPELESAANVLAVRDEAETVAKEAARLQETLRSEKQVAAVTDLAALGKTVEALEAVAGVRLADGRADLKAKLARVRAQIEEAQNNPAQQLAAVEQVEKLLKEIREDQGRGPGEGGDQYNRIVENPFLRTLDSPLSTFSIDVDTASYSKTRMYLLQQGALPPADAVRIEELVNYFDYDYDGPKDEHPFAAHLEAADCPWNPKHRLVRIALKGREIEKHRPASNLVFLLDVSGSMDEPNKLPLVKAGMGMLVRRLGENDRVAIVVYAGAAGLVLPSTVGTEQTTILNAIERLHAGGSTNGGEGLQLAYQTALDHFIPGGVNRVILCTDGDFNVGVTSPSEIVRLAEQHAKAGVYLSILGFGMGNHNDAMLEEVSGKANGNYAFIDTEGEARKVLVEQMNSTLVTIAKDVKIQVEFNPAQVAAYRLLGYENRMLAAEDFNDDKKDAGEIGAGHTVTALYEIVPADAETEKASGERQPPDAAALPPAVDDLKYQTERELSEKAQTNELLTLKLRYKQPDADASTLMELPLAGAGGRFSAASRDFQFAAAVAAFGMILRDSQFKGDATLAAVQEIAESAKGEDRFGYRGEFLEMVKAAKRLRGE